jgi:hypothetical protein
MLEEAAAGLDDTTKTSLSDATILSYSATASDEMLMHEMPFGRKVPNLLRIGPRGDPTTEDLINFALRGVAAGQRDPERYFARTVPTDDDVCAELVRELDRRGVQAGSEDDPVVLVSESDTFYGRALPVTFMRAANAERVRADKAAGRRSGELVSLESMQREHLKDKNNWGGIYWFSYFRGIDGRLPTDRPPEKSAKADASAGDAGARGPLPTAPSEQPEGLDQSDYLRRLADRLVNLDHELKSRGKARGLRAVGVLGSDVYDRLMVLRSLRPRLPGVLFFTNNLDARFAHPSEWDATRNLIVGSGYGLQLGEGAQRNVAPFRDSYQTSVYAATLMATGALAAPRDPSDIPPRVFEIGRTGPFDLSPSAGVITTPAFHETPGWWTPHRSAWLPWFLAALLLLGLCMAGMFRRTSAPTPPGARLPSGGQGGGGDGGGGNGRPPDDGIWPPRLPRPSGARVIRALSHTPTFLAFACPAVVAFVWTAYSLQRREGEPFAFFEGISIWPTEALRLLAGLLSIHFMVKAYDRLRSNGRELLREFRMKSHCISAARNADRVARENQSAAANPFTFFLMELVRLRARGAWPDPRRADDAWRGANPARPQRVDAHVVAQHLDNYLRAEPNRRITIEAYDEPASANAGQRRETVEQRRNLTLKISAVVGPHESDVAMSDGGDVAVEEVPRATSLPPNFARISPRPGATSNTGAPAAPPVAAPAAPVTPPPHPNAGPAPSDNDDRPRWTFQAAWVAVGREGRRRWRQWAVLTGAYPPGWAILAEDDPRQVDAQRLWTEYRTRGTWPRRMRRVLPATLAYLLFGFVTMEMFGKPSIPHRGDASWWIDFFAVMFAVCGSTVLTFFVVDASRFSERLIHYLTVGLTRWGEGTRTRWAKDRALHTDDLTDYLDIQFIARRTAVVSKLIYYPFVVLALLILSRLPVFDNWDWPLGLILLMSISSLYAIWAAFTLRSAAERARKQVLGRLRDRYLSCVAGGKEAQRAGALKELIEEVASVRTGAFAPVSQHPVLGALLLPSGGLGVWALVEKLTH